MALDTQEHRQVARVLVDLHKRAEHHRKKSGIKGGDKISVELTLDTAPRVVEVPAELAASLPRDEAAKAAFARLSYTRQLQHVLAVEGAKVAETRARRIQRIIETLKAGK